MKKTGYFPYRSANSLLNTVFPKDLRRTTFVTGAFERRPHPRCPVKIRVLSSDLGDA